VMNVKATLGMVLRMLVVATLASIGLMVGWDLGGIAIDPATGKVIDPPELPGWVFFITVSAAVYCSEELWLGLAPDLSPERDAGD
jgi:hypothetical protein